jgi:hypothetical protein
MKNVLQLFNFQCCYLFNQQEIPVYLFLNMVGARNISMGDAEQHYRMI